MLLNLEYCSNYIPNILSPYEKNEFTIADTQLFFKNIRDFLPLENEEEDVSYEVESLVTSMPFKETVNYILD